MRLLEFLQINGQDVETYFDNKIDECEHIDVLPRELKNCTCCERHRMNFPMLGCKPDHKNTLNSIENDCKCPCRHIARHICKEWELIHEVEDIRSEEEISDDEDSGNSLNDFIVPDKGFKKKERKEMDKALNMFRGKKNLRR